MSALQWMVCGRPMKVLLTGACGGVGQMLRPYFTAAGVPVRLSDLKAPATLSANEEFVQADLADAPALSALVAGMDGIVHLGGFSVEGPWETILKANIEGSYHLYEAARLAGVQRIVFASSNHVAGFYSRDEKIGPERMVRPDSRYGVSKAFGEALGALYADKHGLRITNLRIGNVASAPVDRRRLAIWLHPDDLFQLIRIALTHPDIRYETFWGMSDNRRAWWDNSRAVALGYRPAHRSEDHVAAVLSRVEPVDAVGDQYQGGAFCSQEHPRSG